MFLEESGRGYYMILKKKTSVLQIQYNNNYLFNLT